jgi:antitoxin (DNA-binding transcriptional repressor) of toxin-antitoxin stability system
MKVSVQYAAEHFEDLVVAAHNGEAVEIACAGQPALQLVRSSGIEAAEPGGDRVLGAGRGELRVPSDEEWDAMDKEWRKSFEGKFGADAA